MKRRPNLIGIAGPARSGKDIFASFLIAQHNGCYTYSFADPMRRMLKVGLGIDLNEEYWQAHKEEEIAAIGKSPRQLLQTLGTEWGRNMVYQDLWLLIAKQEFLNRGPGMIITDVRFANEAQWIRSVGGQVIHIVRENAAKVSPHISEAGVTNETVDVFVYNNMGLEELQNSAMKLYI